METKRLGNIGEAKTLAKFVELGIPVYMPFGENESADLIVDFNGKLNRIQCKTSSEVKNNIIHWKICSTTGLGPLKWRTHKYSQEEVDYFSLYCKEIDLLLLVDIHKINSKTAVSFTYPYRELKNVKNQNNYNDFLFEKVVNNIRL